MYSLPEFNTDAIKKAIIKVARNEAVRGVVLIIVIIVALEIGLGQISLEKIKNQWDAFFSNSKETTKPVAEFQKPQEKYVSRIAYEQAIIDTVASASPSVVSIVISKNVPVYEQQFINPFGDIPGFGAPFNFQIPQNVQKGTKYQEVGAGSGFIVSEDGLILTNKHVVLDKTADYTVLTNEGKKYSAKVLALDPVQDLAIIKIQSDLKFPSIKLGDSKGIVIGQGVIAIGNALGEFRNTVSVGVISGLGRTISASGSQGFSETLENVIQTDAAINQGNSGGPLLNLEGEVIGINTATANGAQTIGFAIPINIAKRDINQVIKSNKIAYPFLGVRYKLTENGALVQKGANGEPFVIAGSPAEKAGVKENDIILEFNGEKITAEKSMTSIIAKYSPGDKVNLKILRGEQEINLDIILGER